MNKLRHLMRSYRKGPLAIWILGALALVWNFLNFHSPRLNYEIVPSPLSLFSHCSNSLARPRTTEIAIRENRDLPITRVVAHVHGYTVFDNMYLKDGTLFIVHPDSASSESSDQANGYPLRVNILSKAVERKAGIDAHPTDQELTYVSSSNASSLLGPFARPLEGLTVMLYDSMQFMPHYYHFWGETIVGAWRIYSSINQEDNAEKSFPPMWSDTEKLNFAIPFSENGGWRDRAGMSAPLLLAGFGYPPILEASWWSDLQKLGKTFVFDRLVLINRNAAHRHPNGGLWSKMNAGTMAVNATKGFWEPVRRSVVKGVLDYIPSVNKRGVVLDAETKDGDDLVPLVTYISRQAGGRRLTQQDHEGLVAALEDLEEQGVIRFHHAQMEKKTLKDQIELVATTTVIVGVHGNGLTHQLWMPSSPWSTVMEIFRPGSYNFDYEMPSRNVGHRHYAVWNDTFVTYPEGSYHQKIYFGPRFHDNDIPVFGPAVAAKIKERLAERH